MSSETEEPNRRTDPWVGRALSELYGEDGTNPYHLTPAEQDISWAGLMELLDEHWPADLFPTLQDDPERDAGARIVSLLRWVNMLLATSDTYMVRRLDGTSREIQITYTNPDSSEVGAKAAVQGFIVRNQAQG